MEGKRSTIASLNGIVAAAHPLAAQAGARVMAQGGNAFDAAAAVAAALNVVEPYMSGLAGMGMATCYVAKERRVRTLDFVPPVPRKFPTGRFKERAELMRGPLHRRNRPSRRRAGAAPARARAHLRSDRKRRPGLSLRRPARPRDGDP